MKNRFREVGVDKIALEYVTLESKYIKDLNSDIDGNLIISMNLIDDLGFNGSYQNELLKDINEYGYNCTKRNLLENRIIYVLSKEVLDK